MAAAFVASDVDVFDLGILGFGRGREVAVLLAFVEARAASILASDCDE